MLARRLEPHEVHHVHDSNSNVRQVFSDERRRRERLQCRNVTGAAQDDVRFAAFVRAGPGPCADPRRAMAHRIVHGQPVGCRLLSREDDVHVVPTSKAVVGHR